MMVRHPVSRAAPASVITKTTGVPQQVRRSHKAELLGIISAIGAGARQHLNRSHQAGMLLHSSKVAVRDVCAADTRATQSLGPSSAS
jgi:hypothetical protein